MSKVTFSELPIQFKKLGDFCFEFRINDLYITDNKNLFVASDDDFCRLCFQRRYLTQISDAQKITQVDKRVLDLVKQLNPTFKKNTLWKVFSVQNPQFSKSFEFVIYEDCPECGGNHVAEKKEAEDQYGLLLSKKTSSQNANIEALKAQIFSFGFAKAYGTVNSLGLDDPKLDKLLGGLLQAQIVFRLMTLKGLSEYFSCMGVSLNKDLAELKSFMEYIERYAFFMQLTRFNTEEYDENIINSYLKRYRFEVTKKELEKIKSKACWGINLVTDEICPIPLSFIFNKDQVSFIKPTSSGFAAHTDFEKSLCHSILELVERDAFVRFWYEPERAYRFEPDEQLMSEVNNIISVLRDPFDNDTLESNFFVIQSPIKLPVVLIAISSKDFKKPPSLSFGCGVGFSFSEALTSALEELRSNAINQVKGIAAIEGFLTKVFTTKIEEIPDRGNFYATSAPREKLTFLDSNNPLVDGVFENAQLYDLDALVDRFRQAEFDVYGLDCTPLCFQDKNVFVTRAFSPQLYPLQFKQEDVFNLPTGPTSVHHELPHFFL